MKTGFKGFELFFWYCLTSAFALGFSIASLIYIILK